MLLVLDNFEHLTHGSSLLSQLISKCPKLILLVTSRERLNLKEEHIFTLEGLPYPQTLSDDAKLSEAVQLFIERAQQIQPRFDIDPHLGDVLKICQLVEGLPLGIELSASWVRMLSCNEIASEIEKGLELLSSTSKNIPERHRSLKATFEYSWRLLTAKEQEVLQKLSIFVGSFRREAASELAGATIPILASLVDKSLLKVLPNGRYDRHPLLYQFTKEKLAQEPMMQQMLQQLHGNYFLCFLQRQNAVLERYNHNQAFQAISEDFPNLDVSWHWIVSSTNETAFRSSCPTLAQYFHDTGQPQVGAAWFERGLTYTDKTVHKALLLYQSGPHGIFIGAFH